MLCQLVFVFMCALYMFILYFNILYENEIVKNSLVIVQLYFSLVKLLLQISY